MENLVENIVDKFRLTFKRLFYLQGTEVLHFKKVFLKSYFCLDLWIRGLLGMSWVPHPSFPWS